jgi:GWxTD domain-containing protein
MDEDNYEDLMALEDPEAIKEKIDRFWLKNIGDKYVTKNVIEKYYNRVVQANKQFSSFKEGWKTDPGLVYILFGPPVYVNRRAETMLWAYSNNVVSSDYNFRFTRPRVNSEFFPFTHYVLNRTRQLYDVQYQQKQLWLSGLILQRRL